MTLFQRTKGKTGLTVEIIRDAVLSALERGIIYPELNDYKEVILEGTKYIIRNEYEDDNDHDESSTKKQIRIEIDMDNLVCGFGGCKRSRNPYKRPFSLINHYKTEHPEAEVYDKEGNRMDEN